MLHQDFLSTFRVSFFPLRVGLNLAFLPRGTSLLKTCQLSPSVSCKQGFRTTYRMPQLVQFITPRSPGTKPFSSKCGVLLPPRKLVTRVLSSGMEVRMPSAATCLLLCARIGAGLSTGAGVAAILVESNSARQFGFGSAAA